MNLPKKLKKRGNNHTLEALITHLNYLSNTGKLKEKFQEKDPEKKQKNWILCSQPVRITGYLPTSSAIFSR